MKRRRPNETPLRDRDHASLQRKLERVKEAAKRQRRALVDLQAALRAPGGAERVSALMAALQEDAEECCNGSHGAMQVVARLVRRAAAALGPVVVAVPAEDDAGRVAAPVVLFGNDEDAKAAAEVARQRLREMADRLRARAGLPSSERTT